MFVIVFVSATVNLFVIVFVFVSATVIVSASIVSTALSWNQRTTVVQPLPAFINYHFYHDYYYYHYYYYY